MDYKDTRDAVKRLVPRGASLLDVEVPPTVAVDGGGLWTGVVAMRGVRVLRGWCVGFEPGRRFRSGDLAALRLDPVDPWLDYYDRVYAAIDEARALAGVGARVVFEDMLRPLPATRAKRPDGSRKTRRVPLTTWVPVRELNAGIAARYPGAFGVPGSGFKWGSRHQAAELGTGDPLDYVPPQLVRKPPDGWSNDHPDHLRNHERAAYEAGKIAQLLVACGALAEQLVEVG